jgi:hypothetical protein
MALQDDQHPKKQKNPTSLSWKKENPKKPLKQRKTKERKVIKALVKSKEQQAVKESEKNWNVGKLMFTKQQPV